MTRIVVVGAGILGAAVADRLAARGADVTVVEGKLPGSGTSGTSFAWVNAQDKAPADYFALNVAGVVAHRELATALGGAWYHAGGDIVIGRGAAAGGVRERIERHRAVDYDVRELDRAGLAALEPEIAQGDEEAFAAAHFPAEAWIDTTALISRLLQRARSSGARIIEGAEVVDMETRGGRLVEIVTRSGDRLAADRFVVAAGPETERLVGLAGVTLPMSPTPGLLVITDAVSVNVAHVIHADGSVSIRPDGGGRLMLASRQVDATLDPAVREIATDAAPCQAVLALARKVLPGLGETRLETARIGIRSVAADGMPVVGMAPSVDNLYLVVSHSGVTLAPVLGTLVAEELLGEPQDRLDPYRPARFA